MRCIGSFLSRYVPHRDSSDTTDGKAIRRTAAAVAEATHSGRNTHGVRISAPHCLPRHDTPYRRRVESDGVPHLCSSGDATIIRYAILPIGSRCYRWKIDTPYRKYTIGVCVSPSIVAIQRMKTRHVLRIGVIVSERTPNSKEKISGIGFREHGEHERMRFNVSGIDYAAGRHYRRKFGRS